MSGLTLDDETSLVHYGIIRRSGRYPWGSGGNYGDGESGTVVQRSRTFMDFIEYLRKRLGLSETQQAAYVGMTTTQLRATKAIAKAELRSANIAQAQRLKDKGWSATAIGKQMGVNESVVREWLAPGAKDKADTLQGIANQLRAAADEKGYVDVGVGVANQIGIKETRMKTALAILESEGYVVANVKVPQLGTEHETQIKVLATPGTTQKEIWLNKDKIQSLDTYSKDLGHTWLGIHKPRSIDDSRVAIRYAEDGGKEADGVMYIRPGVKDVSIGENRYAQVRVAVNDTHYIKGMAIYKDDLPDGVDILFNTNKSDTGNKLDALKPMKTKEGTDEIDWDNPFGAAIKPNGQIVELDSSGKERVTSVMNMVNEEGDWDKWKKSLSSQMLSKQDKRLAKQQLDRLYETREAELDEIMSLTNPVIKERLLESFADGTDSDAVHLQAAAMPRQRNSVIMPVSELKDNEIYAPNFRNGERVALIRHPHGGTFEIPELTVNNNNPAAKRLLDQAEDAVGINAKVAERLSGADFDGDTVLVIPNNRGEINSTPALRELQGFDAKAEYKLQPGQPKMSKRHQQIEMGKVSNLITDMTIMGASQEKIARAVKHSMVVIDAEKHGLDWRRSAKENGIAALKEEFLGRSDAGASTLISLAGKDVRIEPRKDRPASEGGRIDPATGKRMYVPTGGKRKQKVELLSITDDAYELSSGLPIESVYATHSNKMKALANRARKESLTVGKTPMSPSAKKVYAREVEQLEAALDLAYKNKPRERQAQVLAGAIYTQKKQDYPNMSKEDEKKIKGQALKEARLRTGAYKGVIDITPRQWEAIQAGAISTNKLREIVRNSDLDKLKKLATPKSTVLMSSPKLARARSMAAQGYTQADIADALGVSLTTLKTGLAES